MWGSRASSSPPLHGPSLRCSQVQGGRAAGHGDDGGCRARGRGGTVGVLAAGAAAGLPPALRPRPALHGGPLRRRHRLPLHHDTTPRRLPPHIDAGAAPRPVLAGEARGVLAGLQRGLGQDVVLRVSGTGGGRPPAGGRVGSPSDFEPSLTKREGAEARRTRVSVPVRSRARTDVRRRSCARESVRKRLRGFVAVRERSERTLRVDVHSRNVTCAVQ